MNIRKTQLAQSILLGSLILSATSFANAADDNVFDGAISGKLTFASDYVFRGESETMDAEVPVVQGTLGWGNDLGWYAGVFASNIKFADPNLEIVTPTIDDWFGVEGWQGVNYAVHPSYQFDNGLHVSASIGYQDLDGNGAEGWGHWNLGVSKTYAGLNFDVRYHGSTMDSDHKVYGTQTKIFDDRVVVGISKSF